MHSRTLKGDANQPTIESILCHRQAGFYYSERFGTYFRVTIKSLISQHKRTLIRIDNSPHKAICPAGPRPRGIKVIEDWRKDPRIEELVIDMMASVGCDFTTTPATYYFDGSGKQVEKPLAVTSGRTPKKKAA